MKFSVAAVAFFFIVALVAAAGLTPVADAQVSATANYVGNDDQGAITLQAAPTTRFRVYGEQPDGSFVQVFGGMIGNTGTVSVGVVPNGVLGNGTPMFMVHLWDGSGDSVWLSVRTSENDDHLWGWL